jgi:hypothetical protein
MESLREAKKWKGSNHHPTTERPKTNGLVEKGFIILGYVTSKG